MQFKDIWPKWEGPQNRRHRFDPSILISVSILLAIGVIVQYAIGQAIALQSTKDLPQSYFIIRHSISMFLGLVAMVLAWKLPIKFWTFLSPVFIGVGLLGALATVLIGGIGSRWIQLGFFSFQPVEILKVGLIMWAAMYIVEARQNKEFYTSWRPVQPLMILLGLATFVVVLLQKDLGSMVVVAATLISMLWVSGFSLRLFAILVALALALGGAFIGSTGYRRDRFRNFINPSSDCSDTGYHACQAIIGTGSGGLMGKGIGRSVQVYGYLPEANNDSVFAIYAEISGFIGCIVLLAVLFRLYRSIYRVATRSDEVSQLIAAGILTWFGAQTIMNIGAMIGLLPLKGITLPYISYGGSSLMLVLFATGILLQLSSYTMYGNEKQTTSNHTSGRRVRRPRYTTHRR